MPEIEIKDQTEFMEEVKHLVRGGIKRCGKCGLCSFCAVAIHLGWVKDPLRASSHPGGASPLRASSPEAAVGPTPPPWRATETGEVLAVDGGYICCCGDADDHGNPQDIANAQLIAQAVNALRASSPSSPLRGTSSGEAAP